MELSVATNKFSDRPNARESETWTRTPRSLRVGALLHLELNAMSQLSGLPLANSRRAVISRNLSARGGVGPNEAPAGAPGSGEPRFSFFRFFRLQNFLCDFWFFRRLKYWVQNLDSPTERRAIRENGTTGQERAEHRAVSHDSRHVHDGWSPLRCLLLEGPLKALKWNQQRPVGWRLIGQ